MQLRLTPSPPTLASVSSLLTKGHIGAATRRRRIRFFFFAPFLPPSPSRASLPQRYPPTVCATSPQPRIRCLRHRLLSARAQNIPAYTSKTRRERVSILHSEYVRDHYFPPRRKKKKVRMRWTVIDIIFADRNGFMHVLHDRIRGQKNEDGHASSRLRPPSMSRHENQWADGESVPWHQEQCSDLEVHVRTHRRKSANLRKVLHFVANIAASLVRCHNLDSRPRGCK